MDPGNSIASTRQHLRTSLSNDDEDRAVEQRLAALLEANAELARERSLYRSERERIDASLMRRPLDRNASFGYFGFMLGTLPPAAIIVRSLYRDVGFEPIHVLSIILVAAAGIVTGLVGASIGRRVPSSLASLASLSLPNRIAMYSLIGTAWGAVAGSVGGLFLFVFGAIVSGILGGFVGAITVPIFILLHEAVRHGDRIERSHFVPIALGITLSVCAFILGI